MKFLNTGTTDDSRVLKALDRSQAVIEFKPDGTIVTANQNFLDVMGYSLDQIQGKHHSIFVEPSLAGSPEYKVFWEELGRGEFKSGRYKRIGNGGKEIWIRASYNPVLDSHGRPYKIVKIATDVTAQTMQDADYRGQLQAIGKSQAVIEFNLDGTIITANENFLSTVGYGLSEIQGKHHRMFVEPDYAESAAYTTFWEELGRGEFKSDEFKRVGKGGKEVWIQASYNPILDPSGRPFKVVKYATDTTAAVLRRQEAERVGTLVDEALSKIVQTISSTDEQTNMASSGAVETASTVQAVATAASQFDASSQEIARSMAASQVAVERALEETRGADESTQALANATEAMSGIVEIIQNIAGQINLLALNATIESARAGEAGKGFAVVATEVKNLANQVASAIGQISGEIANVQAVSGDVVTRLKGISDGVGSVQESVTVVASSIEEQAAASREITGNMQNASSAVNDISSSLEQINVSVGEARNFAGESMKLYRSLESTAA